MLCKILKVPSLPCVGTFFVFESAHPPLGSGGYGSVEDSGGGCGSGGYEIFGFSSVGYRVAMKIATNSLFVYGTLKQGQLRSGMWPHAPQSIQPALVRGLLLDLGAYPGLLAGDDWVLGELWTLEPFHMPQTLESLDAIEGYDVTTDRGLYVRRTIPVQLVAAQDAAQNEWIDAYTYLISDPDRIASARRIHATVRMGDTVVATWPDPYSRVPTRPEDE